MLAFDLLAERKIEEALARGELAGLPCEGRPLELDDDALVPEELRVAYRVLKNAGYLPPEIEARREIADLERLLLGGEAPGDAARARAARKLALLRTRIEPRYAERVLARLARP